ncbi:MAG: FtsX-like permease family protein [Polyangiaceae bacterium]
MNLFTVAAKNVGRNKGRSFLTVLGASVAIVTFILLRTVLAAWNVGVEAAAKDRLATRHKVSFILDLPHKYIDDIRRVNGVKGATFANWFGGKDPKNPNGFFATLAVESDTFFDVYDEMKVDPDVMSKWKETKNGAIVGDVLARQLGVKPGDKITLSGTIYPGDWQYEVIGVYEATRKSVDRSQFVFHYDYLNDSLPAERKDRIGFIGSRIDDPTRSGDICAAVDKLFDDSDTQTVTMSEKAMGLSSMAMMSAILSALDIVSVVILFIMTLILGNTIAMGVRERTNEYGVLRAIGFRPKHIALFILGEALTVGLFAGLLGLALSYPIVELGMGRFLEENMGSVFPYFRIEKTTMLAAVFLAIGLSVSSSLIPAYQASRLSVTDALRRVA